MTTIATETPIIPELLAEIVVNEAVTLIGERAREHAPAEYLVTRAERHFQENPAFSKGVRGSGGREYLLAFLRHWLAAHLLKHGTSRYEIPTHWANGHGL